MTNDKIKIPIVFCFDNNYVIPAAVAFYSLMENANKDYLYMFYVLHSDIIESNQLKLIDTIKEFKNVELEFVNMNHRFEEFWDECYKGGHFSKEVIYKLLVASIFPDLDKILVSDVDVVFLNDVAESFFEIDCETSNYYIAGVKPIGKISNYYKNYKPLWTDEEIKRMDNVCGGFLVMNLKKIREDNMEEKFINSLKENGYRLNQMEQDIFNITCDSFIKHLNLKYVACSYLWDYFSDEHSLKTDNKYTKEEIIDAMENTVQLHYATSVKPWKNVNCTKSEEWFKYIVKTPFLELFLAKLPENIIISENNKCLLAISEKYKAKSQQSIIVRRGIKLLKYIKRNPLFFLKKEFYKKIFNKIIKKKHLVCIFDDAFPSRKSPFRYEEYNAYCNAFETVLCITDGMALSFLKDKKLDSLIENYIEENKVPVTFINNSKKILNDQESFDELRELLSQYKNAVAVVTFLNNLFEPNKNLLYIEALNIPFILNLYPGGGFLLGNPDSDEKLKKVFLSPCFEKVIVTQLVTYNYLIKNDFCHASKISFIPGVVTPQTLLNQNLINKQFYKINKERLDICFVAHKYTKQGIDKGYEVFITTAKILCKEFNNIYFHVVGEFTEDDIEVKAIKDNINFYGVKDTEWFKEFYKDKDIIISPNKSSLLATGHFDGFPTASATEAALNKVLIMCTDDKKQNIFFKDNKDIIFINADADEIVGKVKHLYNNPSVIVNIANNGYKTVNKYYSTKIQVNSRIRIIRRILNKKLNRKRNL